MMRTLLLSLLVLLVSASLVPSTIHAQVGEPGGFSFLRLEPSARAAALGGSYSAVYGSDINAVFYNPALVNEQMHNALSVSYLNHLSDINAGFVAYGRHYDGLGTFSAGLRFLSYGDLERASATGERLGTFSASDVAFTIGLARMYSERVHYGVNAHIVRSGIDNASASALAFDAGVLYVVPAAELTLSAAVRNAGVTLDSFGTTRDELPLDVRVGVTKRLRYLPLLVSVMGYNLHNLGEGTADDATALDNVLHHVTLGGEFQFSQAFNVRFGYNHRLHESLKLKSRLDFAGVGFGFGLKVTRVSIDYAYNSWSSNGGLHQFTLGTRL